MHFTWYQIFVLDSIAGEVQGMFSSRGSLHALTSRLTYPLITVHKQQIHNNNVLFMNTLDKEIQCTSI